MSRTWLDIEADTERYEKSNKSGLEQTQEILERISKRSNCGTRCITCNTCLDADVTGM